MIKNRSNSIDISSESVSESEPVLYTIVETNSLTATNSTFTTEVSSSAGVEVYNTGVYSNSCEYHLQPKLTPAVVVTHDPLERAMDLSQVNRNISGKHLANKSK